MTIKELEKVKKHFDKMNIEDQLYNLNANELAEDFLLDEEGYNKKVVNYAYNDFEESALKRFLYKTDFTKQEIEQFFNNYEINFVYDITQDHTPYGKIARYAWGSLDIELQPNNENYKNEAIEEYIHGNKEEFYDFILSERYEEFGGDEKFKDEYGANEDIIHIANFEYFIDMIDEEDNLTAEEFIQRYLNF